MDITAENLWSSNSSVIQAWYVQFIILLHRAKNRLMECNPQRQFNRRVF